MIRSLRRRAFRTYLRLTRSRPAREIGLCLILIGVIITEVSIALGSSPHIIAPVLVLAIALVIQIGGLRAGLASIVSGLAYGVGRSWTLGAETAGGDVVGLVLAAGVLSPGIMLWVRSANETSRRWTRIHARLQAWSDLKTVRRQHRAFLNGIDALVWEMDPVSGEVLLINSYAETMLGYPAEQMAAKGFSWQLVHPEDLGTLKATLAAVLRDGCTRPVEYRIAARDGYPVWIRDSVSRATEPHGATPRLQGLGIDISARKRAENELYTEKERYRELFENVPVGLYRMAPGGRFLVVNDALVHILGYSTQEEFHACQKNAIYAEAEEHWRWQKALLHSGGLRSFEVPCRRRDGQMIWVRNTARAVKEASGVLAHYEGVLQDITERKRAELAEQNAEEKFRGLVEQSLVGICMVQGEALVYANPKMAEIFGYTEDEVLELPSACELAAEEHRDRLRKYVVQRLQPGNGRPLSFHGRRKDGSGIEVEIHCTRATFNDEPAVLGTLLDITARKEAEDRLFHAAYHDALTGLPNRILFMERLQHALRRQQRGSRFAVLFLDLNRFKIVNDSLGHPVGDQLLQTVAQRLQTCVRSEDSVARFGGDEFALLLEQIEDAADAVHVAERVRAALSEPMLLGEHEVFTGVSIGIALSSQAYDQPEEVLRNADMAMYRAKASGMSRYEIFDQAMHSDALERLRLETDLQRAVDREEFYLLYQPIVSLDTGRLLGFEALVRWNHPERGPVLPDGFMPIAEELGLIVPIGRQILTMACAQCAAWRARFPGAASLGMSVNLSPRQIQGSAIVQDIRQTLESSGLPAANLKLEITEGAIIEDREAAGQMLSALKELGVAVLLDDFGTGYSSLGYLHSLPIDALKIDRSFVMRLEESENSQHLVRTILNVAHSLGMSVVAEGVESEAQAVLLAGLGCEAAQGYFFSAPRAPEDCEGLIQLGELPLEAARLPAPVAA
jgi:diguanylate cyclase (GGDEF)-like protein/PAS domain S-box-containing protein